MPRRLLSAIARPRCAVRLEENAQFITNARKVPGRGQPKLKVKWKITPLTDENDPDGSERQRQLQVILQLLRKASKHADAE